MLNVVPGAWRALRAALRGPRLGVTMMDETAGFGEEARGQHQSLATRDQNSASSAGGPDGGGQVQATRRTGATSRRATGLSPLRQATHPSAYLLSFEQLSMGVPKRSLFGTPLPSWPAFNAT